MFLSTLVTAATISTIVGVAGTGRRQCKSNPQGRTRKPARLRGHSPKRLAGPDGERALTGRTWQERLGEIRTTYVEPFFGDGRRDQQAMLHQNSTLEASKAEKRAKRNLKIATGALGLSTLGLMTSPVLVLMAALPTLYFLWDIARGAWRDLTKEGKVAEKAVAVIILSFALMGGFYFEVVFGGFFVMLIGYLTVKAEDHTRRSLTSLYSYHPRTVWVLVDDVETEIPLAQLRRNDTIIVQAGQVVPADGVILRGAAGIDQRMLTGEAYPAEKAAGDPVFTGTTVLSGRIYVTVHETGEQTVAAAVTRVLNDTSDYRDLVQSRAQKIVDKITLPTLLFAGVTWATLGLSAALGVLMVYPGYRLLLLNPLSMLSFLHIGSRHGILIKDGRSLELLNEVTTVVFDKTGTLTLDQLQVAQIHSCHGSDPDMVLRLAAAAESRQSHPIAQAVLAKTRERGLELPVVDNAQYVVGFGLQVSLDGCRTVRVGSRRFMVANGIDLPADLQEAEQQCHDHGHLLVMVALDDRLLGAIELEPMLRPEAAAVVDQLRAKGLKMAIISGDHEAPTRHLAERLGIETWFAEVLPDQKAEIVRGMEEQGQTVCFVGDGINDAIALKSATSSVSIRGAMAIATDTAQTVLMDGTLTELPRLFDLAASYQSNIRFNFGAIMAPPVLYVGGAFLFGWGFMTAIVIQQGTGGLAIWNVMRPLSVEEKQLPGPISHPTSDAFAETEVAARGPDRPSTKIPRMKRKIATYRRYSGRPGKTRRMTGPLRIRIDARKPTAY